MLQVSHVINFYVDHVTLFLYDSSGQAAACSNDSIRLEKNNSDAYGSAGRVEICKYNQWFLVTDHLWDDQDARVACVQLGFVPEG